MQKLRTYLNGLAPSDQAAFATRCETTIGYLRKAISAKAKLDAKTCILIERESGCSVRCEDIRTDCDWAFIRNASVAKAEEGARA